MKNLIRLRDGVAELAPNDPWTLLREVPEELSEGRLILPLKSWLALESGDGYGVWLAPDEDPEELIWRLKEPALIAIDFPSFRDGAATAWPTCCAAAWAGAASCARWAMCCATSWRTCASAVSTPLPCARTSPWKTP